MTTDYKQMAGWKAKQAEAVRPIRAAVDVEIGRVGWRRARPVVARHLGLPEELLTQRGGWRRQIGRRNGFALLASLEELPRQTVLFPDDAA